MAFCLSWIVGLAVQLIRSLTGGRAARREKAADKGLYGRLKHLDQVVSTVSSGEDRSDQE